jgi:hypothetical protein
MSMIVVCNRDDQSIACLWNCLYEPRRPGVIIEDSTNLGNRSSKDIVSHKGVGPNRADELVFGQDLVGVSGQLNEDLHDLGFEVEGFLPLLNTVDLRLDFPVPEMEAAFQILGPSMRITRIIPVD